MLSAASLGDDHSFGKWENIHGLGKNRIYSLVKSGVNCFYLFFPGRKKNQPGNTDSFVQLH